MAAAEGEAAAAETGEFAVGERVFVPYVDKVYEAKVLKVRPAQPGVCVGEGQGR